MIYVKYGSVRTNYYHLFNSGSLAHNTTHTHIRTH